MLTSLALDKNLQDIFEIMTKIEILFGKPKLLIVVRLLWILTVTAEKDSKLVSHKAVEWSLGKSPAISNGHHPPRASKP